MIKLISELNEENKKISELNFFHKNLILQHLKAIKDTLKISPKKSHIAQYTKLILLF